MIGNNSAGARSIVYGKTIDHVRRLGVVLADGSRADFGPVRPDEWERRAASRERWKAASISRCEPSCGEERDEIERRFPRILRRVSGYNLDVLSTGFHTTGETAVPPVGLHQLIVGSEGTLAVVTEAELGLLPRPKVRGLLVPQFATLGAAMDALAACLELQPSAVELMDHLLLELTAQQPGAARHHEGDPGPAAGRADGRVQQRRSGRGGRSRRASAAAVAWASTA